MFRSSDADECRRIAVRARSGRTAPAPLGHSADSSVARQPIFRSIGGGSAPQSGRPRPTPHGRPVQAWEEGGARWGSGSVGVARPQRRRRFGPPSSGAPKGFGSEAGKGAGRRGDDDGEDEVVEVADGRGSAEAAMAAHGKSEGHPGRVRR